MERRAAHANERKEMESMKETTKQENIQRSTEMEEAREFAELCRGLTVGEKQQVRSIIIGIQIAKEAGREVVTV